MNEENTTLLPLEERQVDFYGDVLVAALVDERNQTQIYVPVRPLCDYLGIDWASQYKRIQRDPVLSEVSRSVVVTTTEAGRRDTICLPLEYLNGWLFGLNANRVKRELRQKIIQYQKDCYWVLAQAFQADALTARGTGLPAETQPGAATMALLQIREMGLAIVQMAEQQLAIEQRMSVTETRLDRAAAVVGEIQRRLGTLERRLSPGATITEEQATEVSVRVKALAELLTSQDSSKNQYQGIFAELYRRFGVSSYKLIGQEQYEAVLAFLDDWRKVITADKA